jgi:U3 small nucleolar RNA-associated protein 11
VVFVDSKADVDQFDVATHLETAPELVGRTFNRPRLETLKGHSLLGTEKKIKKVCHAQPEWGFQMLTQLVGMEQGQGGAA